MPIAAPAGVPGTHKHPSSDARKTVLRSTVIPIARRSPRPYATAMNSSLAFMNLGGQEMIIIFLVILLLFGAKKLPELARGIGKSMGEFKKAREDFEKEITRGEDDVRVKEVSGKEARDKA